MRKNPYQILIAAAIAAILAGCGRHEAKPVLKYNIGETIESSVSSVSRSPLDESEASAALSETPAEEETNAKDNVTVITEPDYSVMLPQYEGEPYELVNNNVPEFTDNDFSRAEQYFEDYSPLDSLGRVGTAEASFGPDTIPDKKRGDIGYIKPSGWKQAKYKGIGEDGSYDPDSTNYLWNRAHLLMFALGGNGGDGSDNGNLNLCTGTRYMNVQGMLPFENKTLNYVKDTGNRVLYRVTPIFLNEEVVARGVKMEAASVKDKGRSLSFNVYVFNVQPGIHIDYTTGESYAEDGSPDLYAGKS